MKRAILMPIRPEWVVEILNGRKTAEISKTAPKCDLPIDVYIYCAKSKDYLLDKDENFFVWDKRDHHYLYQYEEEPESHYFQGKVVAKFTLNEVRDLSCLNSSDGPAVLEQLCLSYGNFIDYLCQGRGRLFGWHISDLVIFDKPKELSEFKYWKKYPNCKKCPHEAGVYDILVCANGCRELLPVQRAPRSWQYVEVEE